MPKFYETKEARQLIQKWYNKLEDEGFQDIEIFTNKLGVKCQNPFVNSDVKNLYKFRNDMGDDYFSDYAELTYLYFSSVRNFLTFAAKDLLDGIDLKILELHAEGKSIRKIEAELRNFVCRYPKYNRNGGVVFFGLNIINRTVNRLKEQVRLWNLTNENGIRVQDYIEE